MLDFKMTRADLASKIGEYIKKCEVDKVRAGLPGLAHALDIPEQWLDAALELADARTLGDSNREEELIKKYSIRTPKWGHYEEIQKGLVRIKAYLERDNHINSMFLLKQKRYGGYTDKPGANLSSGDISVKIEIEGVGRNTNPFE